MPLDWLIPPGFIARMSQLLGEEAESFLDSFNSPPVAGLRVNTLKLSPAEFQALSPFSLTPVPWCLAGFIVPHFPDKPRPGQHPYHRAGLYYLQEPTAMAAAEILAPQPGELVLDLCAAPGGKATHLIALMADQGLLVANEIHPRRAQVLAENLQRWGARQTVVLNEKPERLARHFGPYFDRILVDAPCSGEGMFRDSQEARRDWSLEHIQGCARRQREIMKWAAQMVRPGGWLLYATCTFAPEENEAVIADFLHWHSDFEVATVPRRFGFAPGRPDWVSGLQADKTEALRKTIRLWPHQVSGEGHFIALLHRVGQGYTEATELPGPVRREIPSIAARSFREFCHENLNPSARPLAQLMAGPRLYALPDDMPNLSGLRVLEPGWLLGTVRQGRFEPAHALALSLRRDDARLVLDLAADDRRLYAYLLGQPVSSPGEAGWVLVCVDGFPIGWGKRVGGMVKSHYPRSLRHSLSNYSELKGNRA